MYHRRCFFQDVHLYVIWINVSKSMTKNIYDYLKGTSLNRRHGHPCNVWETAAKLYFFKLSAFPSTSFTRYFTVPIAMKNLLFAFMDHNFIRQIKQSLITAHGTLRLYPDTPRASNKLNFSLTLRDR